MSPCFPRMTPFASGWSRHTCWSWSPSSKPGRCQSVHTTSSPNTSRVSSGPFDAVAMAMHETGCMWSTWRKGTNECSGVSMEGARALRLKVQCGYIPTMESSAGVLAPRSDIAA